MSHLSFVVGIPVERQAAVLPEGLVAPKGENVFVLLVNPFGIAWLLGCTKQDPDVVGIVPRPIKFLTDVEAAAGGTVSCKENLVQNLMKLRDLPLPHIVPISLGDFIVPSRYGLFVGDAPFSIQARDEILRSVRHGGYEYHIAWDTHKYPTLAMVNFDNRRIVFVPMSESHSCLFAQ